VGEKKETLEARELSAKYTTDVVSNAIFGIDAQSFTKGNDYSFKEGLIYLVKLNN
jgi:hypothetical protein